MMAILGASGHAREVAFIIRDGGGVIDYFVTSEPCSGYINGTPIISEDEFFALAHKEGESINAFAGIGDVRIRKRVIEYIKEKVPGINFPNLFHKSVIKDDLENNIIVGEGNIFFPGTILTTNIDMGSHNHFNCATSISHDCIIGNYNSFSPGVRVAGNVRIGNCNFLGTNSTLINNIEIKNELIIGAGATVINNLKDPGTYIGSPAKKIK